MTVAPTDTDDRHPTGGLMADDEPRLAELTVGDDLLLYDDERPGAWIQTAAPVALADVR